MLETDEVVALKRLKMERETEGFPITSLREIKTQLKAQHRNIVTLRVRQFADVIQDFYIIIIIIIIHLCLLTCLVTHHSK